jgi:hypothetical protein
MLQLQLERKMFAASSKCINVTRLSFVKCVQILFFIRFLAYQSDCGINESFKIF